MSIDQDGFTGLMASVAGSLHEQAQIVEMLRAIVFAARDTVPGAQEAGISVVQRRRPISTAAATAPIVYQLDNLQYQLREGPGIDALQGPWRTSSEFRESRWPRYAARAARLGVESQIGLRLFSEQGSVAMLSLYSSQPNAFDSDSIHLAGLFTTQAAYALGRTGDPEQVTVAISTREVIGHAVGIVMERNRLTEQDSFAYLVRLSHTSKSSLSVIATQIVADVELSATAETPVDAA